MGPSRRQQYKFLHLVSMCRDFMNDLRAGFIRFSTRKLLQELGETAGLKQNCHESLMFELAMKSQYGDLNAVVELYRHQVSTRRMYI